MRPCNQCGKPVENNVYICRTCSDYNRDHGIEPKKMIGLEKDPPNLEPSKRDYSYTIMMLAFTLLVTVIGGLIGYALAQSTGVAPGAIFGFIFGVCFLVSAR